MADPIEEVRLLKQAISRALDGTGLELVNMGLMPEDPDGAFIDVAIRVTPAAMKSDAERDQAKIDAQFESLMGGSGIAIDPDADEKEEKGEEALGSLIDNLKDWNLE